MSTFETLEADVLLVAVADQAGGAAPTISDDQHNAWLPIAAPATNGVRLSAWLAIVDAAHAGDTIVTIAHGLTSKGRAAVLASFAGLQLIARSIAAPPLDTAPDFATRDASPYVTPASGALAAETDLLVGLLALQGAGSTEDDLTLLDPEDALADEAGTTGGTNAQDNVRLLMTWRELDLADSVTVSIGDATANRHAVAGIASFLAARSGTGTGWVQRMMADGAGGISAPASSSGVIQRIQAQALGAGVILIGGLVLLPPDRQVTWQPRWLVDVPNSGRGGGTIQRVDGDGEGGA